MKKIKVFLADDHAVLRAGLKALLNAQTDMEVVGESSNGEETVNQSVKVSPDLIVMDIMMPRLGGQEATRQIKRLKPEIKILVLTMHEDEEYLRQMLRAGADGYLPKKAADTELLEAIRATCRGEHFVHSSMTAGIFAELRGDVPRRSEKRSSLGLSKREIEVLRLLAVGHTSQEIAEKLYLGVKTVETYKFRLKEKLGIKGRAQLVRYAISHGLLGSRFESR